MSNISGKQVTEVIRLYCNNNSVLETAKETGLSTVKVRKILITEGLWESNTSISVDNLLRQGFTTEEIAERLHMSVKNVQAYMPYERGLYSGEEQSLESVRADRYRKRMKNAAVMQVVKKIQKEDVTERMEKMADSKIIKFRTRDREASPDILRLHLELDMKYAGEDGIQTLKKYGSMEKSISRDVLVPSDITLHALNYAILRMFGWQNGHLHNFSLPDDVFEALTENQFSTWARMAGVYFRFPTENFSDIYWDDDYKEGQSIKSWMRKKYTGPYRYAGDGEHYLINQMEVKDMFSRYNEITVRKFLFRANKQEEPYKVKLKEATIEEVRYAFADMFVHELVERLPLVELLRVPNTGKTDFEKVKVYLNKELSKIEVTAAIEDYEDERFTSMKRKQEFLGRYDIQTLPITDRLCYSYDYGDGWKVSITCAEAYQEGEMGIWTDTFEKAADVPETTLKEVIEKHRPICIAKDGIELVDDVGGIGGFCNMLREIYECDIHDEEQMSERERTLDWADMMGWTGRNISPKRTL